jgi:phosphatidylserine decarboxylase
MALSRAVGWMADRRIPRPLRAPIYRAYSRFTGADLGEVRDPLADHVSMAEFFVRRLREGTRPIASGRDDLASPCDGTVQSIGAIEHGGVLQAKGRAYPIAELLGDEEAAGRCAGGSAWTLYLSPRDYHRVHAPEACRLQSFRRLAGTRFSVAPKALDRRLVLPVNERAVFELHCERGPLWLVMVGALNVGRIRLAGTQEDTFETLPRSFARGEELARFEMGSTVVLVAPADGLRPAPSLRPGDPVRLGASIGTWSRATAAIPR